MLFCATVSDNKLAMAYAISNILLLILMNYVYSTVSGHQRNKIVQTDGPGNEMNTIEENLPLDILYKRLSRRSVRNVRTRREVKTLVDGMTQNAQKLENLTRDVEFLVTSTKVINKGYEDINETLGTLRSDLMGTLRSDLMHSIGNLNPLLVSLFVMLSDVTISTSPRLAAQKKDLLNVLYFFRRNISTSEDGSFLDKNLISILNWYNYSSAINASCKKIRDDGFKTSGVNLIKVRGIENLLPVWCDQETDGGGWLVIQRRKDGSEDFLRSWSEYEQGFGDVSGEFWLGNEYIHKLTSSINHELRVDIMDFDANTAYAKYSSFTVASSSENFIMTVSGYSGTAGDSMGPDNGGKFYVVGQGNSCVNTYKGPWWRVSCLYSNLNGVYSNYAPDDSHLSWYYWKNQHGPPLRYTEMKIRPSS